MRPQLNRGQNNSTSTSETNTPEVGSSSPKSEGSADKSENEDEVFQTKRARHKPPDVPTLGALLKELALDDHSTDDASQLLSTGPGESSKLCEIRSSPGKGLGVFATVDIPRGTRIMANECLFYVVGPKAMISEIEAGFNNLTPAHQNDYLALRCPDYPGKSPIIRRWEANCFAMDHDTGIFLEASRINHSCTPNALFKWNANIQRETVHAIVDIPAGTEIETSYCPPHKDAYSRREKLEHYGFDCLCDPCRQDNPAGKASEARRCRMMEVNSQFKESSNTAPSASKADAHPDSLNAHLELIRLLEEEQLFQKELGDEYRKAAVCFEAQGDRGNASAYARMGLQNDLRCLGADSPMVQEAMDFLQSLNGG